MTGLDDARRHGVELAPARMVILEATSASAAIVAAYAVWIAVRRAVGAASPWGKAAILLLGSLAFSAAHVALMILLRTVVFGAAGMRFSWAWDEAPYEYRKDLIAYAVIAGVFWVLTRQAAAPVTAAAPASEAGPATFDIRDGARVLRVPLREILAAKAAGNYVEFALEDGSRPLMRASMTAVETALGPGGFVRTHRSWLVNAARVRALVAAGSGDFRVELGDGVTAPLSRRYPDAHARLSAGG
jgi:DNA-binding LytR/AlgR family response regulator